MTPGERAGFITGDIEELEQFGEALDSLRGRSGGRNNDQHSLRVDADDQNVEQGLAKLVLSLVELLRQLLEKQALRRMESGTLTDEEIERLGITFMKLRERIESLQKEFGLEGDDLNIDLGPLGDLIETPRNRHPRP